jgi:hypothetical protein
MKILKAMIGAYFKELSQRSLGDTEDGQQKDQSHG